MNAGKKGMQSSSCPLGKQVGTLAGLAAPPQLAGGSRVSLSSTNPPPTARRCREQYICDRTEMVCDGDDQGKRDDGLNRMGTDGSVSINTFPTLPMSSLLPPLPIGFIPSHTQVSSPLHLR